jgi:hypothetical protein
MRAGILAQLINETAAGWRRNVVISWLRRWPANLASYSMAINSNGNERKCQPSANDSINEMQCNKYSANGG